VVNLVEVFDHCAFSRPASPIHPPFAARCSGEFFKGIDFAFHAAGSISPPGTAPTSPRRPLAFVTVPAREISPESVNNPPALW